MGLPIDMSSGLSNGAYGFASDDVIAEWMHEREVQQRYEDEWKEEEWHRENDRLIEIEFWEMCKEGLRE